MGAINVSAETGNADDTVLALQNDCVNVGEVDLTCADMYHTALNEARRSKGEGLTLDEIAAVVAEVNEEVKVERLSEWREGREGGREGDWLNSECM